MIRGDLDRPCIPYEYFGRSRHGFSSGAKSVEVIKENVSAKVNMLDSISNLTVFRLRPFTSRSTIQNPSSTTVALSELVSMTT